MKPAPLVLKRKIKICCFHLLEKLKEKREKKGK
jgi:hypothetical protein